ncbi:hypothetical protein ZWY2020_001560 [Hordeum vulgare]|nr:hypothetical protein ZWY2020_001560 [Hordeum vulgare]
MAGRSFAALFQDSQGADKEEDFFGDGSVSATTPTDQAAAAPFPLGGGFSPHGCLARDRRPGRGDWRPGCSGRVDWRPGCGPDLPRSASAGWTGPELRGSGVSCPVGVPACSATPRGLSPSTQRQACGGHGWTRSRCGPRHRWPRNLIQRRHASSSSKVRGWSRWWCCQARQGIIPTAKVLATFWKEVQVKSSGGRGPNGEILARFDEEDNQPRNGVEADLCDGTGEDDTCSPMGSANKRASSSSKRAKSIGTTGESPSKETKSPMVKALRGLVNEIKIDREEGKKKEDNYAKREEARSRAMVYKLNLLGANFTC